MLPPFLRLRVTDTVKDLFYDTVFEHKSPIGPIRSLWWPTVSNDAGPSTVILFIPGNPGVLDFYTPFLNALYSKDKTSTLAILAHSHIGHSPEIDDLHFQQLTSYSLPAQVQGALQAYDAVRHYYGQNTKIVLIGHSVGAWVALQIVKARQNDINSALLLFPTITHISKTRNGVLLAKFFTPIPRYVVSMMSYLTRLVPDSVLSMIFSSWPAAQIRALRVLLNSPGAIRATMSMADAEMQGIKDLDISLIIQHKHCLRFYFAQHDDWVGENREVVLESFEAEAETVSIVHGHHDIPHAFCINHGEAVAEQCHEWLLAL